MEPIIIGRKSAIKILGVGWCWYYDNTGDDQSFDYCLSLCNEQESILLEKLNLQSNRILS